MKRFLSVFLPNWSVDLCHRHGLLNQNGAKERTDTVKRELLFAVTCTGERLVARCCTQSRKAGVTVGIKLTDALSRTRNAFVAPFEPDKERNALYRLAQWAYKFSPLVAPDKPPEPPQLRGAETITDLRFDGINLDLTGCERLFKGELRLVELLCTGLADLGLSFRVAVAPTLGSAWAFSRYGAQQLTIIDNSNLSGGKLLTELAGFPVSALRLPSRIRHALADLNIRLIGELTRLPRKALLARFEPILLEQLDYALGQKEELITPVRFNLISRAHKVFDGPTTQLEAITKAASVLIHELLAKLEVRGQKLSKLRLELTRVDAPGLVKDIPLSVSTSRFEHIWGLLRPKIENFDLGFGVTELTLTALNSEDIVPVESGQSSGSRPGALPSKELGELIDSLNEELGPNRLLKIECVESHFPEQAFSYQNLLNNRKQLTKAQSSGTSALVDADRPAVLLSVPQPIQAMALLPDSPPFWIKWGKQSFNLKHGIGPERIAPAWWGRDEEYFKTRDYFKVTLNSGLWLWIYRELETSRWFLHGIWV